MIENPNFSLTETKYFQAVPILLIGNTAPHDVLVKRKPTRNVFKNLCDYRLCSALFCEEQLREITTLKKTSSLSNMKFYFLSLRIKVGSLTSINISLCGNCILKFCHKKTICQENKSLWKTFHIIDNNTASKK